MTPRPALFLLLAAALLAGCAAHPPPAQKASTEASGRGTYKIGSPYQINGVWYYPAEDFSYEETGIASWYGEAFHGKFTANGEIFDLNGLTAAHHTLPMPSIVEVTNLENGRTIALRVNDRGPFARGRIIDVSRRAAQLLGFEAQGTAKIRLKILVPESIQAASLARHNGGDDKAEPAQAVPRAPVVAEILAPTPGVRVASTQPPPLPPAAPTPAPQITAAAPPPLSESVAVVPTRATQIYIQAGAYARADNALRVKDQLDRIGSVKVMGARVNGVDLYRVRLGPVPTVDEADKLLNRVLAAGLTDARIVVD